MVGSTFPATYNTGQQSPCMAGAHLVAIRQVAQEGSFIQKTGLYFAPSTSITIAVHDVLPEVRLKVRPSGVVGVGGENQFKTEPTTGR